MKIEISDNFYNLIKMVKYGYEEIMYNQEQFEERVYHSFSVQDDLNDTVSILGAHKDFITSLIEEVKNLDIGEVEL